MVKIGRNTVSIPADGQFHMLPTSPVRSIETVPVGIIDIRADGSGVVCFPDLGGRMISVSYTFGIEGDF